MGKRNVFLVSFFVGTAVQDWVPNPCPIGDADGDGVLDDGDNCPELANPDQEDLDNDGQAGAYGPGEGCSVVSEVVDDDEGPVPPVYSWSEAKAYCDNLVWAGYDDWQLPNREHYEGIFHPTAMSIIEEDIFFNTYLGGLFGANSDGYMHLSGVTDFYSI